MSDDLMIFGTPFPSIENDNKNYVPVWKQKAVSAKGTKRFHGAFEGGFSAGYFNSVGSKEGWKPSEFVSSRDKRYKQADNESKDLSKVENFMDEDDLADYNYKELIFIGSNELSNFGDYSSDMKNDTLKFISKYFKASESNAFINVPNKQINEAFSGGGAWDEDDEKSEFYEKGPELYKISAAVESFDRPIEDSLILNFSDFVTISKHSMYTCPNLPDIYVPRKLQIDSTTNLTSETIITYKSDFNSNSEKFKIEDIDEKTASAALKGFMPFSEDPEKQARYTRYLRYCSGKTDIPKSNLHIDEKEREEFIMSAQIFKPSSSIISARFESSSTSLQTQIHLKAGLSKPDPSKKPLITTKEVLPIKTKTEESSIRASLPRRITYVWVPTPLLCKRFNIASPDTGMITSIETKKAKPILAEESVEQMVNALLKDSKNKLIDFGSSQAQPKEGNVLILPDDDIFDEIFGARDLDLQIKSNRVRAIDYFDD